MNQDSIMIQMVLCPQSLTLNMKRDADKVDQGNQSIALHEPTTVVMNNTNTTTTLRECGHQSVPSDIASGSDRSRAGAWALPHHSGVEGRSSKKDLV